MSTRTDFLEAQVAGVSAERDRLEAQVAALETEKASLRLERDAAEHNRLKDNEHLIAERDAAYARAVSDVVEDLRNTSFSTLAGDREIYDDDLMDLFADHIEKWAADRKAGT
jgi:hypothetical protein